MSSLVDQIESVNSSDLLKADDSAEGVTPAAGCNLFVPDSDYARRASGQLAEYKAAGIECVPVIFGEKNPKGREANKWTERTFGPEHFDFSRHAIGLKLGYPSRLNSADVYLLCLDFDTPSFIQAIRGHLPPTGMRDGRPGNEDSHWFYALRTPTIPPWAVANSPNAGFYEYAVRHDIHPGVRSFVLRVALSAEQKEAAKAKADAKRAQKRGEVLTPEQESALIWNPPKPLSEVKSSGAQTVGPPSPAKVGQRVWSGGRMGEPARVSFDELMPPLLSAVVESGGTIPDWFPDDWRRAHGLPLLSATKRAFAPAVSPSVSPLIPAPSEQVDAPHSPDPDAPAGWRPSALPSPKEAFPNDPPEWRVFDAQVQREYEEYIAKELPRTGDGG